MSTNVRQTPGIALSAAQPSLARRAGWPLLAVVLLAVGLTFSLLHAPYHKAPRALTPPASFSIAPAQVVGGSSGTAAVAPVPIPAALKHVLPNHLYIPSLGVHAAILPETLQVTGSGKTRLTTMPVPAPKEVGISTSGGALSGGAGTVLIAGHVNFNGVQGALARLAEVRPRTDVWTTDSTGRLARWLVYANPVYPKGSAHWPVDVFSNVGARRLVLVTCTGTLHYVAGYGYSYDDNQFIYATPAPI